MFKKITSRSFFTSTKHTSAAVLLLGTVFAAGAVVGTAGLTLAKPDDMPRGGVGAVLHSLLSAEPNMLAEDHVALSCEREFSVKIFTAEKLSDATFTVSDTDTGAILYGPENEGNLSPLWQTVWLGPLAALPPKITVHMTALTASGAVRESELILEPQCDGDGPTNITNNTLIINPWGKILVNPELDIENGTAFIPLPPLVMAVPEELVGQSVDTTVVRRLPEGDVVGGGTATIETEIVQMQLTGEAEGIGGITVPLNPPTLPGGEWHVDSFFDVTYRIDFSGAPEHNIDHPLRLINATSLESAGNSDGEFGEGEETTTVH